MVFNTDKLHTNRYHSIISILMRLKLLMRKRLGKRLVEEDLMGCFELIKRGFIVALER